MYWIHLTGIKTKIGYGFDYCEDIHTERCKNDIKLVFTSRRERIECSLKDFDFRIEKEQEDEEWQLNRKGKSRESWIGWAGIVEKMRLRESCSL